MENEAHSLFDKFLQGKTCKETLSLFQELCSLLHLDPRDYRSFYHKLKGSLNYWKAKALWVKLDKRASHQDYERGESSVNTKCLVLGAGPCGLRTAIELAFLGAKVIIIEKRDDFLRNNVLHLWPFTIHDLRALGAKKFYGKFCSGSLDHISIRQLQLILLKVALILGVEIHINVEFKGLVEPPKDKGTGWQAHLRPAGHAVSDYEFDVFVSAGGGKYVPEGFKKKEMRGKLAIGITANFVNNHSTAEVKVQEISGVAYLYNQKFFQQLYKETGIDLENIVYYKDDTHYFVMTARKKSLLNYGVIHEDKQDADSLLSADNVDSDSLLRYARDAANFSTKSQMPNLEFATNHQGKPDVAMFDFTCMYRSEYSALVKERHGRRLLIALVGDCLVEPFWPLGTGIARGFLAAFDAAWLVRKWIKGIAPLELLAERESIYQLLSQTTPANTSKNISQYSIDPVTRYPHINLSYFKPNQVQHLYDTGQTIDTEDATSQPKGKMLRNDSVAGYEELLHWFQVHTEGYKNVNVVDLTMSWKSGLALCALIHHFRPDLIDFEGLKEESVAENNQLAFNIAEKEFGISPIMTGKEMATLTNPDKLSMIMYLTQFNEFFRNLSPENQGFRKKAALTLASAKSALMFLNTLRKNVASKRISKEKADFDNESESKRQKAEAEQDTLSIEGVNKSLVGEKAVDLLLIEDNKEENKHPKESIETTDEVKRQVESPNSSEVCYLCKKRVYVVERFSVEGHFFHRGCFSCHHCGTTLRLGSYALDSRDGKFYCSVHYTSSEERNEEESDSTANEDAVDGQMEWCSTLEKIEDHLPTVDKTEENGFDKDQEEKLTEGNDQHVEDTESAGKYVEEDIDEGLHGLGEIIKPGDEESKLKEKGPFECTEHGRVPAMGHLTSPGRNPSQIMDQVQTFSSQSMVDHQRSNHESSSNSNLAAGSGRNSTDYKNNVEPANAEDKQQSEACYFPSTTQSTATSHLNGTNNILTTSAESVPDDNGNKIKMNADRDDVSKTTSGKNIQANPEFPESSPSYPGKPLHTDNANRVIDTISCKDASTNEHQSCTTSPDVNSVSIKVSVDNTERESEPQGLPTEPASVNNDFKLAMEEEKSNITVPKKKLALSSSIRRKLARLSVTSESDSEGQDDDLPHNELFPSICISTEIQDLGQVRQTPSNSSSALMTGNSCNIEEQDRSQACWEMPHLILKDKPCPNTNKPLCATNQLEVPKDKTSGELIQEEKPNEKDSGSETKLKLSHFSKMFSRKTKGEKKSKEPINATQLPKAEISIAQVPSVSQEEVKSCSLDDDEELDEDEEESLSEDESDYCPEPPLKAKPSPEEMAARRDTLRKRTIERRAKQEETARLLKAQMIQRRLEEIEQMYLELEQKGIRLEEEMRKGDQPEMMQSWFTLVQDKNKLLSEESELMISGRELELQDQKSRLEQELRVYMNKDPSKKSKEDHLEEERLFKEMIEVVKMRDKLVAFLEEQRLQEMEPHAVLVPGAAARDLSTSASIAWT
ncbi:F-actin-monooxygenase mical1-like isoform X2 [Hemitrygon akajei]|uniref:F-actin-monooxygenase mical1-like isoform X2 n=1 Tax=Hemitrygon akajei TaxID=2704970 RepID=UPI003BF99DDF